MDTELKKSLKRLRNDLLKNMIYTILSAGLFTFILLIGLLALLSLNIIAKDNFPKWLLYVPISIAIILIVILIRNYLSMRKQMKMNPILEGPYK